MINVEKLGIQIITGEDNHTCFILWSELDGDDIVPREGEVIPWTEIETALTEAGIDLDSSEMQAKIAEQRQARIDAEPTPEQLTEQEARRVKKERVNQLKQEIRNSAIPQSLPGLVDRIEKLEIILDLRDEDE